MIGAPRGAFFACLLVLLLASCWSSEEPVSETQKYYFLESLKQVEAGGTRLRTPNLDQPEMNEALAMLDQGLRLAFEVDREFLDQLDLRLGKNFERYFVKGVENYRLGIEAGDEQQQREGLRLLARWSEFWQAEQAAIRARLEPG
ncbi:MAG TPA: hypothetical protein VKB27_18595 [Gammaproteobacteria bacterium]|nr:hypothetical protein [Gammaproteobacteria bacterium]